MIKVKVNRMTAVTLTVWK